jgi:hypothetical protein
VVLAAGISTPRALILTATLVAAVLGAAVAVRRRVAEAALEVSAS